MVRETRTHLPLDEEEATSPKALTKAQFGQRVYSLMLKKGWKQSDLARHSGLKRDSISTYVRGRVFPTPQSLQALAKALGVKPEELLPNIAKSAIDADEPSLSMRASTLDPAKVWLQVNQQVSMKTALRIAQVLEEEKEAARNEAPDAG